MLSEELSSRPVRTNGTYANFLVTWDLGAHLQEQKWHMRLRAWEAVTTCAMTNGPISTPKKNETKTTFYLPRVSLSVAPAPASDAAGLLASRAIAPSCTTPPTAKL
jgi:hypothetical protein